jgi:hypothetical protein
VNVLAKAAALSAAWVRVTGKDPPTRVAVLWPLAQADLETSDGDAWGGALGPHNWGAVDLRAPNAVELMAIKAGTLKTGYWLHADGTTGPDRRPDDVGQLHLDSHPGGVQYAMFFQAEPDDAGGAAVFLRVVLRMVGSLLADPTATLEEYASRLYERSYFEGTTPGGRPYGHRSEPLTAPELANVNAYVAGITRCLATLTPALAGWVVPGGATGDPVAPDVGDPGSGPAAGQEAGEVGADERPTMPSLPPAA